MANYDPGRALDVTVSLDSPQYVTFGLWYRQPGDKRWTAFAGGKDDDSASNSEHTYRIGPLASGTDLYFYFHFVGNPKSAIKVKVSLGQDGALVAAPTSFGGQTDKDGFAQRKKEVSLQ